MPLLNQRLPALLPPPPDGVMQPVVHDNQGWICGSAGDTGGGVGIGRRLLGWRAVARMFERRPWGHVEWVVFLVVPIDDQAIKV